MNYLALVNRHRRECGVSGAALTTLVGASGESLRCAEWVQQAWTEIQESSPTFDWLRKSVTFSTIANQQAYSPHTETIAITSITQSSGTATVTTTADHGLTTGDRIQISGAAETGYNLNDAEITVTGLATFTYAVPVATVTPASGTLICQKNLVGEWKMDSFRCYLTATGVSDETHLDGRMGYAEFRDTFMFGSMRTTYQRPSYISARPNDKALLLGYTPDAVYTVVGEYFRTPVELSADADIPAMPTRFHMAIVYKAMMHYGMYEAAPEVYQRGETLYKAMIKSIEASQLQPLVFGGALA